VNLDFEHEELIFPTEEGYTLISGALGLRVLWNKADILFEMPMPVSQRSHPSSSPPGDDPGDDNDDDGDDNGGNGNENAGGPGSTL
jgi:hypothetical protein